MDLQVTNNQDLTFEKVWLMFQETDKKMQETREQMKETDRRMLETDRRLNKIGKIVGGMGRNNGALAEEYFYRRLKNHTNLFGIEFTHITRDLKRETGNLDGQYDLVLHNGDYLFIIEIKYKLHPKDILKFKEKSVAKFKILFPEYTGKKIFIGMAAMIVSTDCKEICEENGFLLITQSGKDIKILNQQDFSPTVY